MANTGDDLIMAGITFQIFAMVVIGVLAFDIYRSKKKAARAYQLVNKGQRDTPASNAINAEGSHPTHLSSRRNIMFFWAISFAYAAILIRCIYRIHEMAGGWGNPRMRDGPLFLILDGMIIVLASLSMTVAHPGFHFSPMQKSRTRALIWDYTSVAEVRSHSYVEHYMCTNGQYRVEYRVRWRILSSPIASPKNYCLEFHFIVVEVAQGLSDKE